MAGNASRTRMALRGTAPVVLAWLLLGPLPATAQDTANSGASFWIEEAVRQQRARPNQGQRIRRLMPGRQFARPTLWHERPAPSERVRPSPARESPTPVPTLQPPVETATTPPAADSAMTAVAPAAPNGVAALPPNPEPDAVPPAVVSQAVGQKPLTVAVIGDNLAQWLAAGLTEAYPAGSGLVVQSRTRESSGLVRDDFYDWPKALRELIANGKPDVVVVMIGSNDRQALRGTTGFEEPLSKGWEALYGKRVEAIVAIAREKKLPVLWVGNPVMKAERFSADIRQINEIEQAHVESAGGRFIDIYDAFADEKGQYSPFGPDVNGQIVKLRTGDGIHFTMPGARKLAHFLEGDLRRLRDVASPPAVAVVPPSDAAPTPNPVATAPDASASQAALQTAKPAAIAAPAPVPERPAIGPVLTLTGAPSSAGGELLGRPGAANARVTDAQRTAIETLLTRP